MNSWYPGTGMGLDCNPRSPERSAEGERQASRRTPGRTEAMLVEQLMPPLHLRVAGVLDLHPGGHAWVGEVATIRPLPHHPFKVPLAGDPEQIHSPPSM